MENNFGDVIVDLRRRRFLLPADFAEQVGIKETYLTLIESNLEVPDRDLLERMAIVLDMPVSALLFETIREKDIQPKHIELYKIAKPLMESLISIMLDETTIDEIEIPKIIENGK